MTLPLPAWLTKAEAARKIGCSVKTVERLADTGKLEQQMRPRPGGSPVAVFNPKDVERAASERAAAEGRPYVLSTDSEERIHSSGEDASSNLPAIVTPTTPTLPAVFVEQLGAAIAAAITGQAEQLEHRDVLSLVEVRRLKGWPARFLMQLHRAGKPEFCAVPGRRGRMIRPARPGRTRRHRVACLDREKEGQQGAG